MKNIGQKEREMELMPKLRLGWLNGWLFLAFQSLITGILLATVPRNVFRRLIDRSGFSKSQKIMLVISKTIAVCDIVLITLTPLKIGSILFIIGTISLLIGLTGLTIAVFNFKNTPLDQPVISGIYKLSRHPQNLMQTVSTLGTCIAIGSWIALFVLILAKIPAHFVNIAEEECCIEKYGDSYREYMKRTPRYFLLL